MGINTDPDNPEWFFVKFKQPGPPALAVSAPTPTISLGAAAATPVGGSPTTTAGGWSFANVQGITYSGQGGLLVYGEAVNNTGSAQRIVRLTGTFYDGQGQVLAGMGASYDYWPIYVVPAGAQVPFKLIINGVSDFADFDLNITAQPSNLAPRQDFQFSDLDASSRASSYCVEGILRNPGDQLGNNLVIVVILYNAQGNAISFDSYEEYFPEDIVGDETLDFEVCVDPLNQEVARYELRAWGE